MSEETPADHVVPSKITILYERPDWFDSIFPEELAFELPYAEVLERLAGPLRSNGGRVIVEMDTGEVRPLSLEFRDGILQAIPVKMHFTYETP